ncbi:CLUMA_CG010396, isoform A [Clunio marinus]|uniref:CLUMA_CG010396, isoform A n=1 Tax=Clunio marinus TaxID=568069 RepID=A0A1J1I9R6_9DIPT|nr:CLUMA_CG010396, isoform A [Clunio marinus]
MTLRFIESQARRDKILINLNISMKKKNTTRDISRANKKIYTSKKKKTETHDNSQDETATSEGKDEKEDNFNLLPCITQLAHLRITFPYAISPFFLTHPLSSFGFNSLTQSRHEKIFRWHLEAWKNA